MDRIEVIATAAATTFSGLVQLVRTVVSTKNSHAGAVTALATSHNVTGLDGAIAADYDYARLSQFQMD